jgi:flagellar L-ring protein precursor FlgH
MTAYSLGLLLASQALGTQAAGKPKRSSKQQQQQQSSLDVYLQHARQWALPNTPTPGSLWNPEGRLSNLASDAKAYHSGDLVTIALSESTTSALQSSVQTQRTFNASSNMGNMMGGVGQKAAINALLNPSSSQVLNGKGQTQLSTSLVTTLAASVIEVLPNGLMVIEAKRDVNVTNQKQTVALRGVIRAEDVSPNNVVQSTAISHLEVDVTGKGVVTEGTHSPSPVMRVLLRIFGF